MSTLSDSSPGLHQSRTDWKPLLWLLPTYLVSFLLFFVGSPEGFCNWEELHTPTAALMILHGYLGDLLGMQYMTFCGGCSVDSLLAVPLVAAGGPSLLLWKLVPWGFSLVALGAGYWVVHRWADRRAAILYGLALILAPTAYQHLAMVGFSNHVQVMGLVWLSLAAWTRALDAEGLHWPFLTGLLAGTTFYYCYTGAFAPPVLLLLYFAWRPRDILRPRGWVFLLGLALPLAWWAWAQAHLPSKSSLDEPFLSVYGTDAGSMISLEHVLARLPRFGPTCWRSLFAPSLGENTLLVGSGVALVFAVGVLGAILRGALALVRRRATPLDIALPGLTLSFLTAYLLVSTCAVADLSKIWLPEYMRYQAPFMSLGAACLAGTIARLWQGRTKPIAMALTLLLLGPGLTGRLASIQIGQLTPRPLFLHGTNWLTIGNRINVPAFNTVDDIRTVVEGSHRIARRALLSQFGDRLGQAILYGGDEEALVRLASWVRELSEEDQASLLRGIAPLVQDRYQNGGPNDPRVTELFDAVGKDATCILRREQYRVDSKAQADRFAVWDSNAVGSPPLGDMPCPIEAGDWAYGYMLMAWAHIGTDRDFRSPEAALSKTTFTLEALEPERRPAFLEGVGERAGELWGYNPWARRRLSSGVQEEFVPAFEAGFERGARWAFVWPIGIHARQGTDQATRGGSFDG